MSYMERLKTEFSENNLHRELTKPTKAPSVSFVSNEIGRISEMRDRWNPELAAVGYVWCIDCQYFNGVNCDHTDNPFRTITKCKEAPRLCRWYEVLKMSITE